MTVLTPGKPFSSDGPAIIVENKLKPGTYVFELVVVDDSGNASEPARVAVNVAAEVDTSPPAGTTTTTTTTTTTGGVKPTRIDPTILVEQPVRIDPKVILAEPPVRIDPKVIVAEQPTRVDPKVVVKPVRIDPTVVVAQPIKVGPIRIDPSVLNRIIRPVHPARPNG